jgi:glucosamine kinase
LGKVLETFDGTLPHSDLSQDLSAEFSHDPAGILAFTQHAAPADYGKYAPRIMAAAKSGDSIAQACVREAVSYIERILAHLDPKSSFDLCPIGGLAQSYIPFFPQEMQTRMVQAKSTALDGATLLATRLAKGL